MKKLFAISLGALLLAPIVPANAEEEPAEPFPVTVMARNLYLGADVGEALELLPDLAAAGQFMWDEVRATSFTERVPLLAQEAAESKPAVIGLQEATTWNCSTGLFGSPVTVYDFTEQFMTATAEAGTPYVVASANGQDAYNPGYSIGPIPTLTTVNDPDTFQPLFGSDTAECGFQLADALLVRADLADDVTQVGITEFSEAHAIIPVVFTVDRGYAWADIEFNGNPVRFVTTHLESMWTPNQQNSGPVQARQIVDDLAGTEIPLVVIGDFNNDPRDPRPIGAANPASQPEESEACPAQAENPTDQNADAQCNAYWSMVQGGYTDVGPDAMDPEYYTWGTQSELAGPAPTRVEAALELGNRYGWTDRLDYVFVKNGISVQRAEVIGEVWSPDDVTWQCDSPGQIANTEAMSQVLADAGIGEPISGRGLCVPTDHAGIVADLLVTPAAPDAAAPIPDDNMPLFKASWAVGFVALLFVISLLTLVIGGIGYLISRLFRRKAN